MNFGFLVRCDEQGVTFHQVGKSRPAAPELLTQAIDENGRASFWDGSTISMNCASVSGDTARAGCGPRRARPGRVPPGGR